MMMEYVNHNNNKLSSNKRKNDMELYAKPKVQKLKYLNSSSDEEDDAANHINNNNNISDNFNNPKVHIDDMPMIRIILKHLKIMCQSQSGECGYYFHKVDEKYFIHVTNMTSIHSLEVEMFVQSVRDYILDVEYHVVDIFNEITKQQMFFANKYSDDLICSDGLNKLKKRACISIECCAHITTAAMRYKNIEFVAKSQIRTGYSEIKNLTNSEVDHLLTYRPDSFFKGKHDHGSAVATPTHIVKKPNRFFSALSSIKTKIQDFIQEGEPTEEGEEEEEEEEMKRLNDDDDDDMEDVDTSLLSGPLEIMNNIIYSKEERKRQVNQEAGRVLDLLAKNPIAASRIMKEENNNRIRRVVEVKNNSTPIKQLSSLSSSLIGINPNHLVEVDTFGLKIDDKILILSIQSDLNHLMGDKTPDNLIMCLKKYPSTNCDYLIQCEGFTILNLNHFHLLLSIYPTHINDICVDFTNNLLFIHLVGCTPEIPFVWKPVGLSGTNQQQLTKLNNTAIPPNLNIAKKLVLYENMNNNNNNNNNNTNNDNDKRQILQQSSFNKY
jgi:hypothetical protein